VTSLQGTALNTDTIETPTRTRASYLTIMTRKHLLETATLIIAAIVCAVVANAFAARDRKIALVGSYPNALKVPVEAPETMAAAASSVSTATPPVTTNVPVLTTTALVTPLPSTTTASHATVTPATATTGGSAPRTATATATAPSPAAASNASQATSPKPDLSKYAPHPDKAYIEIPYADVAALHAGGALFLDARRTSVYEQGHIAGARPFAVWESDVDDKVRGLWEQRQDPKEQALPIVIYCTGGDCEDSHMLAQKLFGALFSNIYVYKDGFPDWQAHQGAAHTGSNP
jgi:rhodanese-related sulfurtransferase